MGDSGDKRDSEDVKKYFKDHLIPRALEKLSEVLETENEKIASDTAFAVLDRDPEQQAAKKQAVVDQRSVTLNVPPEYIQKALKGVGEVLHNDDKEAVHGEGMD